MLKGPEHQQVIDLVLPVLCLHSHHSTVKVESGKNLAQFQIQTNCLMHRSKAHGMAWYNGLSHGTECHMAWIRMEDSPDFFKIRIPDSVRIFIRT